MFGLLGPNGAGKTTTILMLLGLTEPTGRHRRGARAGPGRNPLQVKRLVGYLPDNVGLLRRHDRPPEPALHGAPQRHRRRTSPSERIASCWTGSGWPSAADDHVETYSRGMLQRLGIADALVKDPLVLILDEPTTSIDPIGVAETLELVRELAHDKGVSVLLSSHLLHQVQQVCDRIAIFVYGTVAAMGTVAELAGQQADRRADPDRGRRGWRARGGGRDAAGRAGRDRRRARPAWTRGSGWSPASPDGPRPAGQALVAAGQIPWQLRNRGMDLDEIYQRYFTAAVVRTAAVPEDEPDRARNEAAPSSRGTRRRAPHRTGCPAAPDDTANARP